jgi:hypothetical protein
VSECGTSQLWSVLLVLLLPNPNIQ